MGELIRRNRQKKLNWSGLLFVAFAVIVFEYIISASIASAALSTFILCVGLLLVFLTKLDSREKSSLLYIFLISFSIVTIATVVRWLGNEASGPLFFNDANDQYKFWLASQEGAKRGSIKAIYDSCIANNIYLKNGGYYFYIQSLGFIAQRYFDGNHLLLQQLGTSFSLIFSSIFIFLILRKFSKPENVARYSLYYIALTPVIIDSIGLHRDSLISLFYIILIYFWLCRNLSLVNFIIQIVLCLILINFRLQHGLFAIIFLLLPFLRARRLSTWFYILAIVIAFVVYGISFLDMLVISVNDTFEYYGETTSDSLDNINSGLGRYVYMLPHPIKEIVQVFWLQMQFPAWLPMANAKNIYLLSIGILAFVIYVFWFYMFTYTVTLVCKKKTTIPKQLKIGILIFFVFILLNSSNLTLRRVICVYPMLFVIYAYLKSYYNNPDFTKRFKSTFILGYSVLCFIYVIFSATHG